MKTLAVAEPLPTCAASSDESQSALSREWRRLTRVATLIALLTSPSVFYWYHHHNGWSFFWSLVATFFTIVAFRGVVDVIVRRHHPVAEPVRHRRRAPARGRHRQPAPRVDVELGRPLGDPASSSSCRSSTWSSSRRRARARRVSFFGTISHIFASSARSLQSQAFWMQIVVVGFLFLANFLIFMGPLLMMGVSQIRGYEPGDAEWGVKLDHVRGQAEAKEEIRRVVTLWQSGEVFEQAGGKRERGLLFLGAPGHRQDDDGEGDRDRLQLALRLDPGLRLRPDLHRDRRDHRPLPRPQGEEARPQVGRPVHRLHRRDRRRRHAPPGARRGER